MFILIKGKEDELTACQETVDKSPIFSEVLVELEKWLRKWDLLDDKGALKDATWVTDGVS